MSVNDDDILNRLVKDARVLGEQRMVRDEQPLTDELAKAVVTRFQQYLQRSGRSAESAARSMGVGASTLSQVISGNYGADHEKHIRAIDKWLEVQLLKEAAPKPPGFVKTSVAEQIYGVIRLAQKANAMAVITGPTGAGKTMTLCAIRSETPGAVYVSIDSAGWRVRAVLENIAASLRMTGLRLSTAQLFKQITSLIDGTDRLILVDECHKLAGRQTADALHVLRDLHDATKCPVVLVGNGKLATFLRENHSDGYDPIDQIFGRISMWLDLSESAEGEGDGGGRLCTVEDIQKLFAGAKLRLTPDASRYLAQLACDPSMGCYRAAKYLVGIAAMFVKDQPITADLLRKIQRDRLGKRAAEAAEIRIAQWEAAVA